MIDKNKKVLVVDDMGLIRKSVKQYLAELGYASTVEASNGVDAVEKFKNESPAVVFMDIVMPEMCGDDALQMMREMDADTPIIMLTSVAEKKMINHCRALGATGYIVKPLTADTGPGELNKYLSML